MPHQRHITLEKDHGRIETRRYTLIDAAAVLRDRSGWTDLTSVGWVESERTLRSGPRKGETTREVRYFISSLPLEVHAFAHAVRSHWSIENRCHWCLDMVFQEDQCRVRRDHVPANLATIRRWALSLLREDTTHKHGLKARRLNAAWDPDYLLKLLHFAAVEPATNQDAFALHLTNYSRLPAKPLGSPARCTARISARALLSVSSYSALGLESATTPAPAWMCAMPSCATIVRIAIARSAFFPPCEK